MYEVYVPFVGVLFRNVSLNRCNQFIARHNLTNANICPMRQMLAA